jgi:hypothetical protein
MTNQKLTYGQYRSMTQTFIDEWRPKNPDPENPNTEHTAFRDYAVNQILIDTHVISPNEVRSITSRNISNFIGIGRGQVR